MKNKTTIYSAIGVLILFAIYYLSLNGFSFKKKSLELSCSEIQETEVVEVYVPKSNFVKRKALRIETDSKQFLLKNNSEETINQSFRKVENCRGILIVRYDRKPKSLSGHENIFFKSVDLSSE